MSPITNHDDDYDTNLAKRTSTPPETAHSRMRTVGLYEIGFPIATQMLENLAKHALDDANQPINIIFHSFGGDLFEAFSCIDSLNIARGMMNCEKPIQGLVSGYCMSAATVILQACDIRRATPYSTVQIHGMHQAVRGDRSDLKANEKLSNNLNDSVLEILAERTHQPISYWKPLLETDTSVYFSAKEALEVGLIDEIVTGGVMGPAREALD
jgi:ATP-dependent protease ClpP protease subunit